MTKDEELAMDLALEALEGLNHEDSIFAGEFEKEITAIKQVRLAPVQEPVAGVVLRDGYPTLVQDKHVKETDQRLYTTPPAAQRTWVGLTKEDRMQFAEAQHGWDDLIVAVEAKLKEKNT